MSLGNGYGYGGGNGNGNGYGDGGGYGDGDGGNIPDGLFAATSGDLLSVSINLTLYGENNETGL